MAYLEAISTGFRACLRDCLEILLVVMDHNASARAFGVLFRSTTHSASPRLLSGASGLERNELSESQLQMGSYGRRALKCLPEGGYKNLTILEG